MLVEEPGVPLSTVVTGANRPDVTQLEIVLDNIVIEQPRPTADQPQHLCGDKGYDKTHSSYLALLHLAAAIICWRKVEVIYG